MSDSKVYTYLCKRIKDGQPRWGEVEGIPLADVETGGKTMEQTVVKVCWDADNIYLRYECEDSFTVSPFCNHDDPLFKHDVVEAFIAEVEDAMQYVEIVVSPNNIVYDAWIDHHDEDNPLAFSVHTEWDAQGLATRVEENEGGRNYTLSIPFSNFQSAPQPGDQWRINLFRIDEEPSGRQHFQAWSPTGAINYHIPEKFGWIVFEK